MYGNTTLAVPINTPTFIMAGVQKSGTTALLTYFRDHPQILQTKKGFTRELHFFDTKWNSIMKDAKSLGLVQAHEKNCYMLSKYLSLFQTEAVLEHHQKYQTNEEEKSTQLPQTQLFTFEKTPTYVANPMIAKRIRQVVPWSKVILILRNPVDRLYSAYKMTIKDVYDMRQYGIEDMIQHELMSMKYQFNMTTAPLLLGEEENLDVYREGKNYSSAGTAPSLTEPPHVPYDHSINPNHWAPPHKALGKKSDYGPLGNHILVRRGFYAVQLQWWLKEFTLGENLLVINYRDMKRDTQGVYERILHFCGIPLHENPNTDKAVRADERKDHRPLSNATRRYMEEFYAPYNAQLERLLGKEWSIENLGW
ncbi:MAG: hypothetical protein SGILL_001651 [Bacillariaceae sp.]